MRRHALTALAAIACLVLAGCQGNPTQRWVRSAGWFEHGVRASLAAHDRGVIDDDTLRRLDPVVEGANSALDRAYLRLPDGGTEFEAAMDIVDAAIDGLAQAGGASWTR
jgi:hypothetical protein